MPVPGLYDLLGQSRDREEEEVPGLAELARVVQPLRKPPRMGRVEDGQPLDDLGMVHRDSPCNGAAPVMTDQQCGLGAELCDQAANVGGEQIDGVRVELLWLRRQVVATRIGSDNAEARGRERL